MLITATELKTNLGKYLDTANDEDVFVTRKGKIIAKISNPSNEKIALLDSLVGIANGADVTLEEARTSRLTRK